MASGIGAAAATSAQGTELGNVGSNFLANGAQAGIIGIILNIISSIYISHTYTAETMTSGIIREILLPDTTYSGLQLYVPNARYRRPDNYFFRTEFYPAGTSSSFGYENLFDESDYGHFNSTSYPTVTPTHFMQEFEDEVAITHFNIKSGSNSSGWVKTLELYATTSESANVYSNTGWTLLHRSTFSAASIS